MGCRGPCSPTRKSTSTPLPARSGIGIQASPTRRYVARADRIAEDERHESEPPGPPVISWSGSLRDEEGSLDFSFSNGEILGNLSTKDAIYDIESIGDGLVAISETDPKQFLDEAHLPGKSDLSAQTHLFCDGSSGHDAVVLAPEDSGAPRALSDIARPALGKTTAQGTVIDLYILRTESVHQAIDPALLHNRIVTATNDS